MADLDNWDTYNVRLYAEGAGTVDYTVRWFDDNYNLIDERVFFQVPITENSILTTNTDRSRNTVLNIDLNGDGTIDEIWIAGENGLGKRQTDGTQSGGGAGIPGPPTSPSPQTGDGNILSIVFYASSLTFALFVIIVLLRMKRRKISKQNPVTKKQETLQ